MQTDKKTADDSKMLSHLIEQTKQKMLSRASFALLKQQALHGSQKFTVSQVRKNFTQHSAEEKARKRNLFMKKMQNKFEGQFTGRKLQYLSGYNYGQCMANPSFEGSFYTVQHIKSGAQHEAEQLQRED